MKTLSLFLILTFALLVPAQTRIGGQGRLGGNATFSQKLRAGGNLTGVGNSLMQAYLASGGEWGNLTYVCARRMDASYGNGLVTPHNLGLAGLGIQGMIDAGATTDSYLVANDRNVLLVWEFVNSVVFDPPAETPASALALMKIYGAARKSAGWNTQIQLTMSATPWPDGLCVSQRCADWESTWRYQIDTLLRNEPLGTYWDAVADLTTSARTVSNIQAHGAQTAFPINFVDPADGAIHQSTFGYPYEADVVYPLLSAAFDFPAPSPSTLPAKIKAFFPMWTPTLQALQPDAPDYWGNNHGVVAGNSVQGADAVVFPNMGGTGVQISTPHTLHALSTGFSISGWFKPMTGGIYAPGSIGRAADQWIWAVWQSDGQREYNVFIPSAGTNLSFKTSDDGTDANTHSVTSTVTLANGNWYFFEAGYNGTNIFISVNNETPVTTAISTIKTNSTSPVHFGNSDPATLFIGDIKRFGYAYSALSPTERTYLYNSGTPRNTLFGAN